ncbi:hypothetical protein LWI28_012263 [Acer negundo]|uniref:Pentatricopeptide repeat-containing protein n=1 Tax=Acer negundo TaxID=4023 RepID=A0AAD5IDK9_ACENE|nr:hypothetical protein LWI28_012263 [Acer negundo]
MFILGFQPDLSFYTSAIPLLRRKFACLEEMIEIGLTPADNVFADIVIGFCEVGNFEKSLDLLEDKCCHVTFPHNAMLEICCCAVPVLLGFLYSLLVFLFIEACLRIKYSTKRF